MFSSARSISLPERNVYSRTAKSMLKGVKKRVLSVTEVDKSELMVLTEDCLVKPRAFNSFDRSGILKNEIDDVFVGCSAVVMGALSFYAPVLAREMLDIVFLHKFRVSLLNLHGSHLTSRLHTTSDCFGSFIELRIDFVSEEIYHLVVVMLVLIVLLPGDLVFEMNMRSFG